MPAVLAAPEVPHFKMEVPAATVVLVETAETAEMAREDQVAHLSVSC